MSSIYPFQGYLGEFEWKKEATGGNWDYVSKLDAEGWLYPALFECFEKAPDKRYAQFKQAITSRA